MTPLTSLSIRICCQHELYELNSQIACFHKTGGIRQFDSNIAIIATETDAKFPGFKTINTVVNGCQRMSPTSSRFSSKPSSMKEDVVHQFHLIADKKRLEGPAPIVWLVRKLTGSSKESAALDDVLSYQPSETRAISRVTILHPHPSSTASTSKVGFRLDIDCAVQIEFPKLFLKMLPASRSKIEERGTKSMQKAISQDATLAMEAIRQAWWNDQEEKAKLKQQRDNLSAGPSKFFSTSNRPPGWKTMSMVFGRK